MPPPPRLTAELLVGSWAYRWGDRCDGRITFHADGTYHSYHEPNGQRYVGTWALEGTTVVLKEYALHRETGEPWIGPTRYEFALATRDYPTLPGRTSGGTVVVLSDPRR
ncbi:MAG: hypothetical protein J0I06_18330 [Planctomycetes bacterium]|nr:hypothetical protein [Planctomycetota bacterium]